MAVDGQKRDGNPRGGHAAMHSEPAVRFKQARPSGAQAVPTREQMRLDGRTRMRILVFGVLVAAAFAFTVWMGFSTGALGVQPAVPGGATQALTTRGFLEMQVNAPEWDAEGSTPVILHLRRDAEGTDRYHAMGANSREAIELDAGTYYISFISPVNADGSLYRAPEEQQVHFEAGHTASASAELALIPAGEAQREDYLALIDAVNVAVERGDSTLAGEAGEAVRAKVQANAEASPTYAEPLPEYYYWDYPTWGYSYDYTPYYGWGAQSSDASADQLEEGEAEEAVAPSSEETVADATAEDAPEAAGKPESSAVSADAVAAASASSGGTEGQA